MTNKKVWIALYSQTGSEIQELSKALGIKPTLILTNTDTPRFEVFKHAKHDELMNWLVSSYPDQEYRDSNVVVTLHGYLRIIPPEICARYKNFYNGHPALITHYPELKGKDPQVRTWNDKEKYPIIGSVVHRVTPGVDEGEVVSSVALSNHNTSMDDLFTALKQTSLDSWYFFLKRELCV